MASQDADQFQRLETEIVMMIVGDPGLTTKDLAAFAATCRRHYDIANPTLYKKNIEEEDGVAGKEYLLTRMTGLATD